MDVGVNVFTRFLSHLFEGSAGSNLCNPQGASLGLDKTNIANNLTPKPMFCNYLCRTGMP